MVFCSIEEALGELNQGKFILVVDDEDRENEGDLVVAAEKVDEEKISFLLNNARGLICVPLVKERLERLKIPLMVHESSDTFKTSFTVSVDARKNVSSGMSASDRLKTINALLSEASKPEDFARPGHVFPLMAREGGVLERAGHTEASVDLMRLAGLKPAAVICEVINDDGTMARLPHLMEFAAKHGLKIVCIKDLIKFRREREDFVKQEVEVSLPTEFGVFKLIFFTDELSKETHLALVKGEGFGEKSVLVRVHSECLTGDVFGSRKCDCGAQLKKALEKISAEGEGVLLYMRQEGRGIGLLNKLHAYKLQEQGLDTVEANEALGFKNDLRDYGVGAQILKKLGVKKMRLLTNNPRKIVALEGYGLEIMERIPLEVGCNEFNKDYLETKKKKMGHLLEGSG